MHVIDPLFSIRKPSEGVTASPEKEHLLTCRPDGLTARRAEYCQTCVADAAYMADLENRLICE
jgi:hypothetical protein